MIAMMTTMMTMMTILTNQVNMIFVILPLFVKIQPLKKIQKELLGLFDSSKTVKDFLHKCDKMYDKYISMYDKLDDKIDNMEDHGKKVPKEMKDLLQVI